MARKSIPYSPGVEFDFPETEPFKRRSYNERYVKSPRPVGANSLLSLKRVINPDRSGIVKGIVRGVIEELADDNETGLTLRRKPEVMLASSVIMRGVYESLYAGASPHPRSAFNSSVLEFRDILNAENPERYALIGKISTVGPRDNPYAKKIVRAHLQTSTGQGEELRSEKNELYAHLAAPRISGSGGVRYKEPPSLSLAETYSYEEALRLEDVLNDSGVLTDRPVFLGEATRARIPL